MREEHVAYQMLYSILDHCGADLNTDFQKTFTPIQKLLHSV